MATSIPIHTTLNPRLLSRNSTPLIRSSFSFTPSAKLDLSEIMGGRGLCNGERGIRHELQRTTTEQPPSPPLASPPAPAPAPAQPSSVGADEGAFEKELFGLTGGFPGGENGLKGFIERNPPSSPSKAKARARAGGEEGIASLLAGTKTKPNPPELPLFLPGMIVIVKNPKNPFHMYSGIVQRVTDGKAGVLFEGGNWDKLLTFDLVELERREKGPPMVNPKSAVLESIALPQKAE